jgi:hypothetical protein
VTRICRSYRLKNRYQRLREAGMLRRHEIARQLGVTAGTVTLWRRHALLKAHAYGKANYLYEPLGQQKPLKCQGRKLSDPRRLGNHAPHGTKEV